MELKVMVMILIGVFLLYRIFQRVRRNIGWQLLNPKKMRVSAVIISLVGLVFLVEGGMSAASLLSDLAGIAAGVILAYYGALWTRFEQRGGSWYYRPNLWMGSLVTVLFLGRLVYRIYDIYTIAKAGGLQNGFAGSLQASSTGWTAGLLLIMFAYYAVYNTIILQKRTRMPVQIQ
jgi:putative flippase GtrA